MTVAKSLLTGPLPEDVGVASAVTAARDILKESTENRAREAADALYGDLYAWRGEKGIIGLDGALIDEIDILFAIHSERPSDPLWEKLSFREAVALVILRESSLRPHVAMKGGSVLATFVQTLFDLVFERYGPSVLKMIEAGRQGNEAAYGTLEERRDKEAAYC